MNNQQKIQSALESAAMQRKLLKAGLVERLSGGGLAKKIKRLLRTPDIYLAYLLLVKLRWYRRASVSAKLFWGRSIHIPLQDYDSLMLLKFGFAGGTSAELKLARYMVRTLSESDVVYDIGANYGFYTYLAEELCTQVHAFEPMPTIAEVIEKNCRPSTVVTKAAVAEKAGTTTLFMSESSGLSTITETATSIHSYTYHDSKHITVPTVTLDTYTATHTAPTFLKIDVEGAEELVVKGGVRFFTEHAPTIALEIWGAKNGGEISMRAVTLLRSLGYTSWRIHDNGTIAQVEGDLSVLPPPYGVDNVIFTKSR